MAALKNINLSKEWEDWSRRGKHSIEHKCNAAIECLDKDGEVRGYFSDLVLKPKRKHTDSLYPSIDHVIPGNNSNLKVEARIFNDIKSHLTEEELWLVVEHLYAVGKAKNKIKNLKPCRLDPSWEPGNNYD